MRVPDRIMWNRESILRERGTRSVPDALAVAHRIPKWSDAHDLSARAPGSGAAPSRAAPRRLTRVQGQRAS
jgi:hypothetical protein